MFKKSIKKIINILGFDIRRRNLGEKNLSFDEILKKNLGNEPLILDVGANRGQSIKRFFNLFSNPTIHSFEPIKSEFNTMHKAYSKKSGVFLNNFALGDKYEKKEINVTIGTGKSSFNNIKLDTNYQRNRSKLLNTYANEFNSTTEQVEIKILDDYIEEKKINTIDLIKIDTQGYEDKVLSGSKKILSSNNVGIIIAEIIFDNNYDRYLTFSDLEKYLIPNNFRLVAIDLKNNNIFSSYFMADVMYFNKDRFKI